MKTFISDAMLSSSVSPAVNVLMLLSAQSAVHVHKTVTGELMAVK